MTDFRLTKRFAAVLLAGGLVAGCSSPSPDRYDYRSDSKVKEVSLAVPPNLIDETADQRSLPPQGGETSLSTLRQVQSAVPVASTLTVAPPVTGMHIQRDGSESWLVIDNKSPDQVWPQIRAFWQEQGFLLVVDQRDKSVMETDWNETRPQIDQGLIRNSLTKALGNAYVASERNKYRTRLEVAPSGGTYVFISQKGLREVLTGANSDSTKWEPKANDPGLEVEYLNRLMVSLGRAAARAETQNAALPMSGPQFAPAVAASGVSAAAATAAQNVVLSGRASSAAIQDEPDSTAVQSTATELTLSEPYDRAWVRTGMALDRGNFTVADSDRGRGLYFVRYADPHDNSAAEQGFWSQVFHGKTEKVVKRYVINVRAVTPNQTRIAVITDEKGEIDTSTQAKQIMSLMVDQLH